MSDADASALDSAVTQALAEGLDGAPGAWVGVWLPDKGVHVAAYGKATDSADATLEDHNYIGSLTKTATATAVLQLVDQGTIALTDTVADLDPG
ncbi:MAG: serine hydrolase, partial [Candidatus Nanopelagicales bacterium]